MLKSKNSFVVISRFNEPIEWVQKLTDAGYTCIIYDKCNPYSANTIPLNKGHEASAFLKYIIDYYYNLPEYSILIHAEEHSWHHNGSIVELIKNHEGFSGDFKNINDPKHKLHRMVLEMLPWMAKYYEPELGPMENYGSWMDGQLQAAQFVVHKKLILGRSLRFYRELYKWFLNTEMKNYISARWLEWSWHLIWNQVPEVRQTFKTDQNIYSISRNEKLMKQIAINLIGNDYDKISLEDFVIRLYQRILQRDPDPGGFSNHTKGGDAHRENKVLAFLFCNEAKGKGITEKLGYEPLSS